MKRNPVAQSLANGIEAAHYIDKARELAEELTLLAQRSRITTFDVLSGNIRRIKMDEQVAQKANKLRADISLLSCAAASAAIRPGAAPSKVQPLELYPAAEQLLERDRSYATAVADALERERERLRQAKLSSEVGASVTQTAEIAMTTLKLVRINGHAIEPAWQTAARLNDVGAELAGQAMASEGVLAAGVGATKQAAETYRDAGLPDFMAFTVVENAAEAAKKKKKKEDEERAEAEQQLLKEQAEQRKREEEERKRAEEERLHYPTKAELERRQNTPEPRPFAII